MSCVSEKSGEKGRCGMLRVAVIMGGQSAEREVSLRTGQTVVRELSRRFRVKPVQILASGWWVASPGYLHGNDTGDAQSWFTGEAKPLLRALGELEDEGVEVAFNALHGPMGEDGTVQGLFRMVGIPLTGPDVIPAAVTMDKRLTKQVLLAGGVLTPRFFTLSVTALLDGTAEGLEILQREASRVPFPWILKPNRLGSSVGVAIFQDIDDVRQGARDLVRAWPESALGDSVLVEEVVRGRELTCGVIETDSSERTAGERGGARALPPIEIRPRTSPFFDYHAKYVPGASEEICPAPLSPHETAQVQATALRVHGLLECAPLSRTDMFLTPEGRLQVLEVNTLPGMTATSLIPLSASKAGILLGDLLGEIVEHALRRARLPALVR